MTSTSPERLSDTELRSKMRYIQEEYNAGRNPLPHITGLHHLDRILLEQNLAQYIRTLRRIGQLRGNQNYAGYKKTFRKKGKKMKKGKSLRKPKKHKKTYKKTYKKN